MTCHYPGTVLWLVLLIVWSKFPPWHSQSEVRARSKRWHFSMEFIYMESNSKHHFVQKPTLASWNVGSFIKQIQSWIFYIYLVDIFVLRLGCWLLSYYLGCWKQQLASSCTHHVSRRFQATHENLLVGWKLNTYVLFLNDFFLLFVRVILFCWLCLLRLKFIWYTADSKKNTKNRSSKFTHKKKGSQSESSVL